MMESATRADLRAALAGETPPLVTPFADGAVDHDALAAVVEHVRAGGVDALFPCGTTGEFASLTAAERAAVVETVVDASGDAPVLAGVAGTAVEDVLTAAEDATAAGADAVVVTPPYYHTANAPEGTVAFVEAVADESTLPVVLYNIPQYVGASFEVETVATLADRPDVLGIKDSSGDLTYTLSLAREIPEDFLVLQGYDPLLLPGLRTGLDGGVNALANVVPECYATMVDDPGSERALRASDAIADLFDVCLDVGFATATKTALVERGVIETDEVRPPLVSTGPEDRERVSDALATATDAV